jgi:hypothetical protein
MTKEAFSLTLDPGGRGIKGEGENNTNPTRLQFFIKPLKHPGFNPVAAALPDWPPDFVRQRRGKLQPPLPSKLLGGWRWRQFRCPISISGTGSKLQLEVNNVLTHLDKVECWPWVMDLPLKTSSATVVPSPFPERSRHRGRSLGWAGQAAKSFGGLFVDCVYRLPAWRHLSPVCPT